MAKDQYSCHLLTGLSAAGMSLASSLGERFVDVCLRVRFRFYYKRCDRSAFCGGQRRVPFTIDNQRMQAAFHFDPNDSKENTYRFVCKVAHRILMHVLSLISALALANRLIVFES